MIRDFIQDTSERRPAETGPTRSQQGQSIIILAFAFMALLAFMGLALDLGLVYIERVRLKRAVDAATLAGVTELPFESQAYERALEYLDANGYPVDELDIYFTGCWPDFNREGPPDPMFNPTSPYPLNPDAPILPEPPPYPPPARTRIILDTHSFQDESLPDDQRCDRTQSIFGIANKLSITGTVPVRMNFMQFFGWIFVPVTDNAIAQNVTSLDVAVVFDRSGSMEFDTICYDCWTPGGGPGTEYPNTGTFHPIPFDNADGPNSVWNKGLCTQAPVAYSASGIQYLIMEAELYAQNNSLWDREFRQPGQGFWAIQRNGKGASSIDGTGTYVSHHPFSRFTQSGVPSSGDVGQFYDPINVPQDAVQAPMLEYVFTKPGNWSGSNAYIWLRVQAGPNGFAHDDTGALRPDVIYWQLEGPGGAVISPIQANSAARDNGGGNYGGAVDNRWEWIRLNSSSFTFNANTAYHLKVWAGSVGYDVDKIVVTNNSQSNACQIEPLRYPLSQTQCNNNVSNGNYHKDALGRPATQGSAYGDATNASVNSLACDVCNPIFGKTVDPGGMCNVYQVFETTNHLANDLFSDKEPVRSAKEAVKNFVKRLDAQFDQAGFVSYSNDATIGTELECRRRFSPAECYLGPPTPPISYTNVLAAVEIVDSAGSTNLAEGMRDGIEVLGADATGGGYFDNDCNNANDPPGQQSHCGRGGSATRVLIIMTDGEPNENPGSGCYSQDLYQPNTGDSNADRAADCTIFYAREAAAAGITIYAIGLGQGADLNLLEAAAEGEGRNGQFFFAPSPNDLDAIFDVILQNIYVRLIS